MSNKPPGARKSERGLKARQIDCKDGVICVTEKRESNKAMIEKENTRRTHGLNAYRADEVKDGYGLSDGSRGKSGSGEYGKHFDAREVCVY